MLRAVLTGKAMIMIKSEFCKYCFFWHFSQGNNFHDFLFASKKGVFSYGKKSAPRETIFLSASKKGVFS